MRYTGFFSTPDSRFPTPDSRLPIPYSLKNLLQKFSKYVIILCFLC
ncbi:MAG: hypothetical protein F6K65_00950 [Moorea sp. SIO3C2]|nr:hypothetical protein [Moorena sp. SIO3C2]